jgi:hypothetical protein
MIVDLEEITRKQISRCEQAGVSAPPSARDKSPGLDLTIWILLLVLASPGCGKLGAPIPPDVQKPNTISDLRIINRASPAQLIFSLPGADVQAVEVYRMCPPTIVEERASLIARLEQEELVEFEDTSRFVFEDNDRTATATCRYALRFVDRLGYSSDFSNFTAKNDSNNR